MFRLTFSLSLLILIFAGCTDLKRNNLLDPKNDDGYTESIILMEAFINTNNPYSYNEWSLQAAEEILVEHTPLVVLCEYHRDIALGDTLFDDAFSNPLYDALHEQYANFSNPGSRSVPDIYLNGARNRINGASGVESVKERISELLNPILEEKNDFSIEADLQSSGSMVYSIDIKIAALGNKKAENLAVKVVFIKAYSEAYHKYVALNLHEAIEIDHISAGGYWSGETEQITLSEIPDALVVSVTSRDKTETYQTILKDLR